MRIELYLSFGGRCEEALGFYLGEDKQRAERIFDALAEGGQVRMPLAPKFWGAAMGMLQDRYGVGWMVSCAP